MANEINQELETMAFDLYAKRVATLPPGRNGERDVIESFARAEEFLAVRKKVRSGEVKAKGPTGPQLSDCCAPNLPRSHPINLVAQTFTDRKGSQVPCDLAKINRIAKFLAVNPTPEKDPDELVVKLNREFPELGWTLPEINTARAIMHAYVN